MAQIPEGCAATAGEDRAFLSEAYVDSGYVCVAALLHSDRQDIQDIQDIDIQEWLGHSDLASAQTGENFFPLEIR